MLYLKILGMNLSSEVKVRQNDQKKNEDNELGGFPCKPIREGEEYQLNTPAYLG